MVEAEAWSTDFFFVISDVSLKAGFITEPEVSVRKTLLYGKNGEIEGLSMPTWQLRHSGRIVRYFFVKAIFLTLWQAASHFNM